NVPLILHGGVVLLLSQLAGYAFFNAIRSESTPTEKSAMWRMSHSACSAGAVFLIALGPVVPHLRLEPIPPAFLVDTLVVSTYALCVGTFVAGFSGHRGTRPRPSGANLVVYALYLVGALGSTVSGVVFVYGATRAYFE